MILTHTHTHSLAAGLRMLHCAQSYIQALTHAGRELLDSSILFLAMFVHVCMQHPDVLDICGKGDAQILVVPY